jgi:hypothetical protein
MLETVFAEAYPIARRAAAVRSAAALSAVTGGLFDREDIEQQAMVALWKAVSRFDPSRGSLRTFVERVMGTSNLAGPKERPAEFELKKQVAEFFRHVRAVDEGEIRTLAVHNGLPFTMEVAHWCPLHGGQRD